MGDFNKIRKRRAFYKFSRAFRDFSFRKVRSYELVIHWLHSKLTRTQFLMLSGILVGCGAGLAGVLLKMLVHYIHFFITHKVHISTQLIFLALFPFLGIVLTTVVVVTFFQGQSRKGIPAILYEIAQNSSLVPKVKMYSQIIQSAITVGLGGSAGLESPIAVTGAAIGSNYAQVYELHYKERTLLLAAGATAGIASAFNAPIAGMMFAFEILLTGVIFSDFLPLIIAAVCGSLISKIILQEEVLFHFQSQTPFNYRNVPYYLALGILSGLYARYFVVISGRIEHFFKKRKWSLLRKAILGGAIVSVLCVLMPPLYGEGYTNIKQLAEGHVERMIQGSFLAYFRLEEWMVMIFVGCVLLLKALATSITIQSGGNGGNFAPSLFAGAFLGYFFAAICNLIGLHVPVTNLVIVGMAGVMSGVMYAPLTAIFLIAESSSGYDLFIPLMIVSSASFLMAKWFSPIWPEIKHMADEGKIFTRETDKNILSAVQFEKLIDLEFAHVTPDTSLRKLVHLVRTAPFDRLAVMSTEKELKGLISLDELRPVMFDTEMYDTITAQQIMKAPIGEINMSDSITDVVRKFDETQSWHLPVVKEGRMMGFLSKSDILTEYRLLMQEYSATE
ncbi:chloride channel protein [Chitinophaga sedimenti]|uniref:chloride channel protein n=1 Tax=Chitinophaga sedimenti TaxID=2033606 RepID=UPI002005285F|nr:chloride channel protein [Chitinophaga sedimenti]MCK7555821.1 chloride channel protein [Chitinophaga sedimenti]